MNDGHWAAVGCVESVYLGARKHKAREGAHMPEPSFQESSLLSGKQKDSAGLSKGLDHTVCCPQSLPSFKVGLTRKTGTQPMLVGNVGVKNHINKLYPPHQFSNLNKKMIISCL